ncbi:hypothetical protein K435DRAFT_962779 [Dendrothele bispora CBS 962.96]|uniref:Uncharacterized protein n=1 Tax=Dendrothele bispora (strain CBS 962.96) TaxID=1314807 RepID=A0A4S8MJ91_DENBC|nr:hypothetical protein K435DRAFT_962779 [Dendrothele bispora CBS 962.96]
MEYHPVFGLIHSVGVCCTCDSYVLHIADVKKSSDASFNAALNELQHVTFTPFFEGIEEGKRRVTNPSSPSQLESFDLGLREGQRREEVVVMLLARERDLALRTAAELRLKLMEVQKLLKESGVVIEDSSIPLTLTRNIVDTPKIFQPLSATTIARAASPPSQPRLTVSPPQEDEERIRKTLLNLMNKAHAGDMDALHRVKSLCREAHATPTDRKTFAQKVLLSEWRVPPEVRSANVASGRRPAPRPDDGPGLVNPRLEDPIDVWFNYYCNYKSSLPRGVPQDAHGRPLRSYLSASRTFARLRPVADTPSPQRMEFISSMIQLFCTTGGYALTIRKERLRINHERRFRPFVPRLEVAITPDEVARHFASCGVQIVEARDELEPWAREYERAGRVSE